MADWAIDEVIRISVQELIPYERNPRIHSLDQITQLANSIKEWGWTMPILVDEKRTVIAGHGRLYAAQELGIEEVPCIVASGWTEEKKSAYVIADNRLPQLATWDFATLSEDLATLSDQGFDMDLLGFSGDELETYIGAVDSTDRLFDISDDDDLISGTVSDLNPRKSEEGFAEFAIVMQVENRRRLATLLNEIKQQKSVESNEAALMLMAETYAGAEL